MTAPNSTQQSHAVGTNPDNRSKCVLMNVSVGPSLQADCIRKATYTHPAHAGE
jgi:hypothetical protein